MNINDDFTLPVLLHADEITWEDSPMAGVTRRRLDKVGVNDERVTTIVRYAPLSHFSSHVHSGGEEFIVLEGIFEDDYGEWPAGSYIRNPPTSSHTPGSAPGCTILVKLGQFHPDDRTFIHAHIDKIGAVEDLHRPGVSVSTLYKDNSEEVRVERWGTNITASINCLGGAELFLLDGNLETDGHVLRKHSWLRVPVGAELNGLAGDNGATIWVKSGHLNNLSLPI